ncbi:ribosomal protein L34-like protein [Parachaetomium inaequale]|uniref:Ste24 endopeptidase n=1 Tax=Parachaetomium inaequale TaxID=2588326 RepID=A0AAN6PLZ4_9PEZI|nr:ribosomal protein L34-like protein [Parachaetomium inaequale]
MDFLQRLARFLDRPLFPWKKLIIGFSIGQYVFEALLGYRQYRILQKTKPPKVLEHEVSQEVFDKSQAYGRAKAKFTGFNGLYGQLQNLAFYHFDVLPKLWSWTGNLLLRFAPARFTGEISHSIVFILVFIGIHQILSLPSSIYNTFVLEEKFGFNKQTPKLFITDIIKSNVLAAVLVPPILAGFLAIVKKTGSQFFYYLWMFGAGLQVFMITIYPIVILPLFNKLSPLEEGKLKTDVEDLAKKLKFPLHELYVIDGSKRSAHSNAYFFGLPWKKHIVIYDTLIEKSETDEVVAVLAHELGHWSLGHTTKLFGISQAHFFYIFSLFSVFVNNRSLYADFGFTSQHPIIVGFLLFSDILGPLDNIIKLLMNILSRRFEFQADAFADNLGYNTELARSLIKLQIQNLSTMDADWMFASYHFSHPILSERLKALNWQPTEKVEVKGGEQAEGKEDVATATGRDEFAKRTENRVTMSRVSLQSPLLQAALRRPTAMLIQRCAAPATAKPAAARTFSHLPTLRPTLASTTASTIFRPPNPQATATTAMLARTPTGEVLDVLATSAAVTAHPALAGCASQIRCGPRPTMSGATRLIQKRRHGFVSRMKSAAGRKLIMRRRVKGRKKLGH